VDSSIPEQAVRALALADGVADVKIVRLRQ
jgi:hypothetical protein